ncbi:MAG: EamA family transporter [Gemmatimonadaceae bacterium]|nr:EamA family transporter [Gemmatimonadaceae bacterium]
MPGYAYIVAAALLWATLGPVARFLLQDGVSALEIGFWRATIAAVLFAVHAAVRRQSWVAPRDLPAIGGFALVGVSLFYVAFFRAVESGGAALAAILLYTAPVWVAIAARMLLGERITTRKAITIMVTLTGVALVAGGSADGLRSGAGARAPVGAEPLFWGLVAGLAYASYYVFGKRFFSRYEPARIFSIAMPVGALALLPMIEFTSKPAWAWALLVFIGAVPTYGACLLYAAGLARTEATRAATIATIEPMAAAVLAFLVWEETLRPVALAGAALILLGVVVTARARPTG